MENNGLGQRLSGSLSRPSSGSWLVRRIPFGKYRPVIASLRHPAQRSARSRKSQTNVKRKTRGLGTNNYETGTLCKTKRRIKENSMKNLRPITIGIFALS